MEVREGKKLSVQLSQPLYKIDPNPFIFYFQAIFLENLFPSPAQGPTFYFQVFNNKSL